MNPLRGATENAIKIRDSQSVVKAKMGAIKILVDTPIQFVYDNGMYFQFNNSTPKELTTIGVTDPNSTDFQTLRKAKATR